MAQTPLKGPPPPRPPSPLSATAKSCSFWRTRALNIDWLQCGSIYLLKKLVSENFYLQRTAMKFSANIIWLLFYLFVRNPRLRVLYFEAAASQGVWGFGGEEPDFSRSGNVALCLFTSKAMAALRWFSPPKRSKNKLMAVLRWFLPRENSCIIIEQAKFKMLAMLINLNSPAPRNKITL